MLNRFNNKMNFQLENNIYLLIIIALAVVIVLLHRTIATALLAVVVIALVYYFTRKNSHSKELFFSSYMDNIVRNIERANHFAVSRLDIGMAVFSKTGKLQWKNESFAQFVGKTKLEGMHPQEILPLPSNMNFETLCVKDGSLVLQINEHYYLMNYSKVETQENKSGADADKSISGLLVYLKDITDLQLLKEKYNNEHICLGFARLDSYEDVMRGMTETEVATLNGEINTLLTKWVAGYGGFICRMNKEMCLIGLTRKAVEAAEATEFDILKKIRAVRVGNKIAPTISIGVDCDGETLENMLHNANDILFQALARGGDQALVVKEGVTKPYGATQFVAAKSTRVRVRLVANAIKEIMQKSDMIFVMGHYDEDFDALGSAIGVAKLAKSLSKPTAIVLSEAKRKNTSTVKIVDMLDAFWDRDKAQNTDADAATKIHYPELMVSEEEALKLVTPKSLLVVVDHHRAALSASRALVEAVPNRIIIDHHRRAEDIMADENTLLYLEPSSSSASEMVTELTGYFDNTLEFSAAEATALYTGIVLDTKSFVIQTGERTFEAAARLRRDGAEPGLVKDLFKDDLEAVQLRSKLISQARMPIPGLAISINSNAVKSEAASVIAAQTSDMLIAATGVSMSVAITEYEDGSLGMSARSDGTVNVQVIMEALGGGGHQTVAGAQFKSKRAKDVEPLIIELAKKQLDKQKAIEGDAEQ